MTSFLFEQIDSWLQQSWSIARKLEAKSAHIQATSEDITEDVAAHASITFLLTVTSTSAIDFYQKRDKIIEEFAQQNNGLYEKVRKGSACTIE